MADYPIISADSHIVEPPDMYSSRIAPQFRDRAPKMERRKTPAGREYDAWMLGGMQVGTLGAVMQAGRSEEHTSELQSRVDLVCRLLLEKKKKKTRTRTTNVQIHRSCCAE